MKRVIETPVDEDFGFTFVDEDFQEVKNQVSDLVKESKSDKEIIQDLQQRLQDMLKSIEPFLENLKKNPDKTTIYWPNRVEKIGQFQEKLRKIVG
jgi:hypothetical protein